MLGTIEILYKNYNDKLYRRLSERLPLYKEDDTERISKSRWYNKDPQSPVQRIVCHSVDYNKRGKGRIWWFTVRVDLRLLFQTKDYTPVPASLTGELEARIDELFLDFFGFDIKEYLPDILGSNLVDRRISYLEYMIYMKRADAGTLMKRLDRAYFDEKQLDPEYFDRFWIRNATPAFTINQLDEETIRLCIKCKENAVKIMFKKPIDPNVALSNAELFDRENIIEAFCRQIKKYTKPMVFEELSRAEIEKCL